MTQQDEVSSGALDAGFSSSKKQILLTLKRAGSVSLTELAASLHISKMATLKHLAILEGKGLVDRSSRQGGRGRPRAVFSLSEGSSSLFPEAYTHMTLSALRFIEEKIGPGAVVQLLEKRAQEVLDANRDRVPDGNLKSKVVELVKIRDEGGYMAELGRAGRTSVEMLEHNCPIMAVAETYPEACRVEREMFQKLLGADVETSHRVVAGDPVCRFLIRGRGKAPA
jgi:predicted ArsR family transcriptional regulator